MTSAMSNWLDLRLSTDEEKFVREAGDEYVATYVHTIESIFKTAKAIDILQRRFYGNGVQGAFSDALVQYRFTARDRESAIDKGIRSNLKEMLASEQAVRDWWTSVPEKKKRDWISARGVYKHWKKSQRPAAEADADAPVKRRSPYEKLKFERDSLVRHNIELKQQLESREDGDTFDAKRTSPRLMAIALQGQCAPYKDKLKRLYVEIGKLLKAEGTARKVGFAGEAVKGL
jgi:hypothetical protein